MCICDHIGIPHHKLVDKWGKVHNGTGVAVKGKKMSVQYPVIYNLNSITKEATMPCILAHAHIEELYGIVLDTWEAFALPLYRKVPD